MTARSCCVYKSSSKKSWDNFLCHIVQSRRYLLALTYSKTTTIISIARLSNQPIYTPWHKKTARNPCLLSRGPTSSATTPSRPPYGPSCYIALHSSSSPRDQRRSTPPLGIGRNGRRQSRGLRLFTLFSVRNLGPQHCVTIQHSAFFPLPLAPSDLQSRPTFLSGQYTDDTWNNSGVVRAPLMTTLMQVSSRFALVWGAVHFYPSVATSPAYSSMLLAWSTTEVIRYLFFALSLSGGYEPAVLQWLRYSGFYVLYPVGISSELWELFLAFGIARKEEDVLSWGIIAVVMATYLPGAPKLYGHMMRQRRKVLGGGASRSKRE